MVLDSDAEAATLVEASDTRKAFKPVQSQQRVVGLDFDAAWYRTAKPFKALQRCEHVVVVNVPSLGEGLAGGCDGQGAIATGGVCWCAVGGSSMWVG